MNLILPPSLKPLTLLADLSCTIAICIKSSISRDKVVGARGDHSLQSSAKEYNAYPSGGVLMTTVLAWLTFWKMKYKVLLS